MIGKKLVLLIWAAVFLGWAACTSTEEVAESTVHEPEVVRLPNIIFIIADDLGYGDLGSYGQARIKTPHIDRLAREGVRFTNFYAGSTVCAPSRSVLMTGQHTGHTHIRGNGKINLRLAHVTRAE